MRLQNWIVLFAIIFSDASVMAQADYEVIETILPFTTEFVEIEVEKTEEGYFLGDMLIEKVDKPAYYDQLVNENASPIYNALSTASENSKWKNGIVPYTISNDMPPNKVEEILDAISILNALTNINIIPRTIERDYVFLKYGGDDGCWSKLGRIGGMQEMQIAEWCRTGSVMHEFMHAIGFWHEHMRPDRDQFIRINFQNIEKSWHSQYRKIPLVQSNLLSPYDFGSIMHYPIISGNFTCIGGCPTAVGQREKLSPQDIAGINRMYKKDPPPPPLPKKPVTKKKEEVLVTFYTKLAEDQINEDISIEIDGEEIFFTVSLKDNQEHYQVRLEKGKRYAYNVATNTQQFLLNSVEKRYQIYDRKGEGSGYFVARENLDLAIGSNRRQVPADKVYMVKLLEREMD